MDTNRNIWRFEAKAYADAMMASVYSAFSAVLSVDASGTLLGVCQFDTAFGSAHMAFDTQAEEIWLVSNHPDGCPTPYAEDEENLSLLRKRAGNARVRLFLAGEDIGFVERF